MGRVANAERARLVSVVVDFIVVMMVKQGTGLNDEAMVSYSEETV